MGGLGMSKQRSQVVTILLEYRFPEGMKQVFIRKVGDEVCALDHRDPFDRMLAAQSELEHVPLVTRDPAFTLFGTRTFW